MPINNRKRRCRRQRQSANGTAIPCGSCGGCSCVDYCAGYGNGIFSQWGASNTNIAQVTDSSSGWGRFQGINPGSTYSYATVTDSYGCTAPGSGNITVAPALNSISPAQGAVSGTRHRGPGVGFALPLVRLRVRGPRGTRSNAKTSDRRPLSNDCHSIPSCVGALRRGRAVTGRVVLLLRAQWVVIDPSRRHSALWLRVLHKGGWAKCLKLERSRWT